MATKKAAGAGTAKMRNPLLAKVPVVRTLLEAHELLGRMWSGRDASLVDEIAYRKVCAALYAEVADIDRGHYWMANYHAQRESETAAELQAQLDAQKTKATPGAEPAKPAKRAKSGTE